MSDELNRIKGLDYDDMKILEEYSLEPISFADFNPNSETESNSELNQQQKPQPPVVDKQSKVVGKPDFPKPKVAQTESETESNESNLLTVDDFNSAVSGKNGGTGENSYNSGSGEMKGVSLKPEEKKDSGNPIIEMYYKNLQNSNKSK